MKNINLMFKIVIFLFSASCIDEEGKIMMMFVNKIVKNPDKMKEIIESSEYYNSSLIESIERLSYQAFINNIKSFKNKIIQYHDEPDYMIQERRLFDRM